MSAPIPMREYVVSGMVSVETVNALVPFGEPMVTEDSDDYGTHRWYRAWLRVSAADLLIAFGRRQFSPWHSTPQFAATALLGKLRAGP